MKKKLEIESLAVDSFETSSPEHGRGTVHGRADIQPTPPEYECTCGPSCLCPSAPYYCAEAHATLISCDYTLNGSCKYPTAGCDTAGYCQSDPYCTK